MDRLYINAKQLGLELKYYNTGNIKDAVLNGEQLSNSDGRRLLMAKTYIDVNTGEIKSTDDRLAKATQDFVKAIKVRGKKVMGGRGSTFKKIPEVEPIKHYGARVATGFKGRDIAESVKTAAQNGKIDLEQRTLSAMYDLARSYGYDSNGNIRTEAEIVAKIINAINRTDYKTAQKWSDFYANHLEEVTPRKYKQHWNRNKVK